MFQSIFIDGCSVALYIYIVIGLVVCRNPNVLLGYVSAQLASVPIGLYDRHVRACSYSRLLHLCNCSVLP